MVAVLQQHIVLYLFQSPNGFHQAIDAVFVLCDRTAHLLEINTLCQMDAIPIKITRDCSIDLFIRCNHLQ